VVSLLEIFQFSVVKLQLPPNSLTHAAAAVHRAGRSAVAVLMCSNKRTERFFREVDDTLMILSSKRVSVFIVVTVLSTAPCELSYDTVGPW